MRRPNDGVLSVLLRRLGMSLAGVALCAQLALGVLVPRDAQATVAALFPWMNAICHGSAAQAPTQPGKHPPTLPGWMVCPFCVALSVPMPHAASAPATPLPAAVWVAWRPLPPRARAPPGADPNAAQPRGPPTLICVTAHRPAASGRPFRLASGRVPVNRCKFVVLASASVMTLAPVAAGAHVIVGDRLFPVTLTFDDPGVADEASLPSFTYQRGGADGGTGATHEFDFGFEYDKTITSNTALIANYGWDIFHTYGSKTQTGFENLFVTGKWQAYTDPAHEFVFSLGLIQEVGGTGTDHTGADATGSTAPTAYFGKGLGDLPIGLLRPLAVTGELGYAVADKGLKAMSVSDSTGAPAVQFNDGQANQWAGGFSVQYSLPYLQQHVRDVGLTGFLGRVIPLVEVTWSSPASRPSVQPASWTVAPGFIYMADWYEVGIEALIPGNKAAGTNVGVVALFHVFLDDVLPNSLGRPIF